MVGLTALLVCVAIGSVWQFQSRNNTGDSMSGQPLAKQQLAEGSLQAHLQRFPNSTEALDELRWRYFNQFRTREIEELLEAHLVRFPDDVAAAYRAIERASSKRPRELQYVHREGLLRQRLGWQEDATRRRQRANELEGYQSELSEIVLRGRHTEPTPKEN